jgi:hypothetical protein
MRRSRANPDRPRRHKVATREVLIALAEDGVHKGAAARQIGVSPSTVWRWLQADPQLYAALADAHKRHLRELAEAGGGRPSRRPKVPVDPRCPFCCSAVQVLTAKGQRFWKCPACGWKSWRPRAAGSCGACGGYLLWSSRRKTVSCGTCRRRQPAPSPAPGGG